MYFIEHLPKDNVPYWDFIYTDGDKEPRDSSASAIAICGILEMAKHIPTDKYNMDFYIRKATDMLSSLINGYAADYESGDEGLILHGTYAKPQGMYDTVTQCGDYYYLEALVRATRDWVSYW